MEQRSIKRKVCLLGNPAVGKTSLIRKYIFDSFSDKYISTVGTKVSKKDIEIEIKKIDLKLTLTMMVWDILGQSGYRSLHSMFYKGASGALIVCDLTRRETYDSLKIWGDSLTEVTGEIPIVFLGNKKDMSDKYDFDPQSLKSISNNYKTFSFLTSAKSGLNVENAFSRLAQMIVREYLRDHL